ncbi:MAG: hypothetical protein IPM17_03610 [Verrucomicrobia bacterium]|nr:hypothetical protein [Verrucomicrobiota bacterium]
MDVGLEGAWGTADGRRTVSVRATGRWVELGFRGDDREGELRINQHVIRIERAHLVVNGRTMAAVPAAAQNFTVTLVGDTLEVRADGAPVFQRSGFK